MPQYLLRLTPKEGTLCVSKPRFWDYHVTYHSLILQDLVEVPWHPVTSKLANGATIPCISCIYLGFQGKSSHGCEVSAHGITYVCP